MKRIIIAMAAIAAVSAAAQDLSTEITVDRIVLPEQKAAQRPLLTPEVLRPAAFEAKILPAEYLSAGSVSNSIGVLAAPAWRDSVPLTPYRGYASLGYFPAANIGANLGYRFLDTGQAIAGAWAQADFDRYKSMGAKTGKCFANVGAYGAYNFNGHSRLDIDAAYQYGNVKLPEIENVVADRDKLCTNQMQLKAAWKSHPGKIAYRLGAGVRYFGYSGPKPAVGALAHQTALDFAVGAGMAADAAPAPAWAGMEIEGTAMSGNNGMPSMGLYSFHPYVIFGQDDDFTARLGVNLNIAAHGAYDNGASYVDSSTKVRVAPQVTLSYHPSVGIASASVTFEGGQRLNPLADLYAANPYLYAQHAYGVSNSPLRVEGAVNVGRTQGLLLRLYGGYALARNWYLPALPLEEGAPIGALYLGQAIYEGCDFNCWHAGVQASYACGTLVETGLRAELAGSNDSEGSRATWLEWTDRAKYALGVYATGHPIEKLEVSAGYDLRACRRIGIEYLGAPNSLNLHNLSNLYLQAHYAVTPALTAFVRGENLLGHKALLAGYAPMQGVHGLVGIAAKF